MQALGIVLLSVIAAVAYGILHDLVTAHVCVQYFTIAHPFVFPSHEPVAMALIWGVLATWWVGLFLGIGLALAARTGRAPKLEVREICTPVLRLLGKMAVFAFFCGICGYIASRLGWIVLIPPLSERIPPELWNGFFFDAFAHTGSYLGGFFGGGLLIRTTWKKRHFTTPA